MTEKLTSRRNVLYGAAAAGVAAPILAACGSDDSGSGDVQGQPAAPSSPATSASASESAKPTDGAIPTADIPVGGGKVFADEKLVVTQPSAGEFKAFTAVCTHTGCLVGSVSSTIDCPCHGSKFSISDGSVQSGPASSALAEKTVTVVGKGLDVS